MTNEVFELLYAIFTKLKDYTEVIRAKVLLLATFHKPCGVSIDSY